MIIEAIQIDGFCQFDDFQLEGLGAGLVVVHGPNEAGKTTLRRFIQWALLGEKRGDRARYVSARGRYGGTLEVRVGSQRGTLRRQAGDRELRLDGQRFAGVAAQERLVGGLDHALYQAAFTFDLFDLQQLDQVSGQRVQDMLAVGTLFGSQRNPVDILEDLQKEALGIWRPRAASRVGHADKARKAAAACLATAQAEARKYGVMGARLAALGTEIARARGARLELDDARREARRVVELLPSHEERLAILADLASVAGGRPALPLETRERVQAALQRAEEARRGVDAATDELASAMAAREAVRVDVAVVDHGAGIDALAGARGRAEASATAEAAAVAAAAEAEARVEALLPGLGEGWDAARAASAEIDAGARAEAEEHATRTARAAAEVPEALAAAERQAGAAAAELDGAVSALAGDDVRLPDGWPALGAADVDDVRQRAGAWREAIVRYESTLRRERDEAARLGAALSQAEAELGAALSRSGADAPDAREIARLEEQLRRAEELSSEADAHAVERQQLGDRLQELPAALGPEVSIGDLARVDASASRRDAVGQAFDALDLAERAVAAAEASLSALPAPSELAAPARELAEVSARRERLIEAKSALDDVEAAERRGPQAPPAFAPWIALVALLALTVALATLGQLVAAGLAAASLVAVAVALWWQRRAAGRGPAPEARAARASYAQAARRAGLSETAGRAALDLELDRETRALAEVEQAAGRAVSAEQARRQRAEAERAREAARATQAQRGAALSGVLAACGLPAAASRELAGAWFKAVGDHRDVTARLGSIGALFERAQGARRELAGALRLDDSSLAALVAGLEAQRARHEAGAARAEAIREATAKRDHRREELARAEEQVRRSEASPAVPEAVVADWRAFASLRALPAAEPDAACVEAAKAACAATARRRELEAAQAAASASAAAAEDALSEARARSVALEGALSAFAAWRERLGAPAALPPSEAARWLTRLEAARDGALEARRRAAEAAAREGEVAAFVARVRGVLGALGSGEAPPRGLDEASAAVAALTERLRVARSAAATAEEREERVRAATEVQRQRAQAAERAEAAWRAAREEVGCDDVAAWEQRGADEAARDALAARLREVEERLRGAFGEGWRDDGRWTLDGEAAGLSAWESRAVELAGAFAAAEEEVGALEAERARLEGDTARLATSSDVVDADTALAAAEEELHEARRAWWRVQLGRHLLSETFERFRKERQPAVITRASRWFELATDGKYAGVEVSDDQALRFEVVARNGARHPADGLSSGTVGLLYLCLRLALALDQASTTPAPILLDDVLAYVDPERAAGAAAVIAALASEAPELQILLFTCRPETVASLRAASPGTPVKPLARWGGGRGPAERASRGASRGGTARTAAAPPSSGGSLAATAAPALPAGDDDGLLEDAVALLVSRDEPLAKSDFEAELSLGDGDWGRLRARLEADPRVEIQGRRRGRRYLLADGATGGDDEDPAALTLVVPLAARGGDDEEEAAPA